MGEIRERDDLTRAGVRLRDELRKRRVREAGEVCPQLALDDNQPVDELDRVGRHHARRLIDVLADERKRRRVDELDLAHRLRDARLAPLHARHKLLERLINS